MILHFLDFCLTVMHLVIIVINLFGWIFPQTRKLQLIVASVTAFCWLILGIWFGVGYCPITDWQWRIKEQLGEHNLPDSFVTYYMDKIIGKSISPSLVDNVVAISFIIASLLSVYFNFLSKRIKVGWDRK